MHSFGLAIDLSWLLAHAEFAFTAGFRWFAQNAAPVAVAALWQGALVAACLAIGLRCAPRISAGHRFAVWTAAFAVLAGLEVLPFLPHFAAGALTNGAASTASVSPHPWFELDPRWSVAVAAVWLALAAIRFVDLVLHSIRLRRLWKSARPIEDAHAAIPAALQGCQAQICTTRELDRPSVIGFFAPRILIPDWLYARLTPGELEQVVLHEAEHLRRRDDWTNLLQKLCLVLFPLNPALVWMERRLCREREMACDEGVVRVTRAPRSYAACLASLAERRLRRRSEALSLGAFERRPELVQRVHSILLGKNMLSPMGARALLGVVGCGLLFGSVELARCPQLVAFVPAQELSSSAQRAQADAVEPVQPAFSPARRAASDFRATNVEAIVPSRLDRSVTRRPAVKSNHAAEAMAVKATQSTSAESGRQLLTAKANPAGEPQELVVFTAWQVETSTAQAGAVADYDAVARPDDAATREENRPTEAASRITVTRMILTVYPADARKAGAPGKAASSVSKPQANPGSQTKPVLSRPAMLPFGSGWLVIQL